MPLPDCPKTGILSRRFLGFEGHFPVGGFRGLELFDQFTELGERHVLKLSDPFAGDAKRVPDFVKGLL